jgi:hypothetical protein
LLVYLPGLIAQQPSPKRDSQSPPEENRSGRKFIISKSEVVNQKNIAAPGKIDKLAFEDERFRKC